MFTTAIALAQLGWVMDGVIRIEKRSLIQQHVQAAEQGAEKGVEHDIIIALNSQPIVLASEPSSSTMTCRTPSSY